MHVRKSLVLLLMMLAGCSAPEGSQRERLVPARPVTSIIYDTAVASVEGAWAAVQMPLEDINLKQRPIPEKLQQVVDNPYSMPPQMLCENINKEITELDDLLGPDVCTPQNPSGFPQYQSMPPSIGICTPKDQAGVAISRKGEYVEQGAGMAREHVVGIVSGKASIIPFRGIVRKISGAEKHSKAMARAYEAGKLRRAFLKGLLMSLGIDCLNTLSTIPPQIQ